MVEAHATGERNQRPPGDQPGSADRGSGQADVRLTVADMMRRERALTELLQTSERGAPNHRAAVEALATIYRPLFAGVALFQNDKTDLRVEFARTEEGLTEPFSWNATPGLLREMLNGGGGAWRDRVATCEIPGAHLLGHVNEVEFHCEAITCGCEVAGFLFRVEEIGEAETAAPGNDLSHLIAARLSSELSHQAERRARRSTEQQFNDLASTAVEWFWAMDANYRFTYLSDRWQEITGRAPRDYLGKTMLDLGADPEAERWAEFFRKLEGREPFSRLGTSTTSASGEVLYWKINGKPFYNDDGVFQGFRGTGTDVSTEVRQKRQAEKAEALLLAAMEAIPQGVILFDERDKLVVCNKIYKDLVPELAGELTAGADFVDLARLWAERTQDRPAGMSVDELFRRRVNAHRAKRRDFEQEHGDGRSFLINEQKTEDGTTVWLHTDITTLKKRETELRDLTEALEQKNAYFDATLNSMVQALATFDPDDRLIFCNGAFQDIFQLPDALLSEGTDLAEFTAHIEHSTLWNDVFDRVASTHAEARKSGFEERKMSLKNGRIFDVQNTLLDNGDLLVTFHEITALEEHAKQLKEYTDKLEYSNRELEEFAYIASHDLQEPLRKIEAFGDRLRSRYADRLDEKGLSYLERMQSSSQRMRTLVRDLLDYSRIGAKDKPPVIIVLEELVAGVISDLEVALEASGGKVEYADLPAIVGDKVQIRQVFQNLISNALKFRKPEQVPVVRISAAPAPGHAMPLGVEVLVADNGIGFDETYVDQIFKIFHRLHGHSEYEGTGIGLATCRKIMERHSGSISAQSELGVGTTVKLTFPMPAAAFGDKDHA